MQSLSLKFIGELKIKKKFSVVRKTLIFSPYFCRVHWSIFFLCVYIYFFVVLKFCILLI